MTSMRAAQGLTLGDSELREYTHGLFGHVARMLGQDFVPFLGPAVAAAVESCAQVRGCFVVAYNWAAILRSVHMRICTIFFGAVPCVVA